MAEIIKANSWKGGSHNRSGAKSTPDGFVRGAVNLVPGESGSLKLRPGYSRLYQAEQEVTCAALIGSRLLIGDGERLVWLERDGSFSVAAELDGAARAILPIGDLAYVSTSKGGCALWSGLLLPWSPQKPAFEVSTEGGGLQPGRYKVAVVAGDAARRRSACDVKTVDVVDGQAIRVTAQQGRAYVSSANGATLYYQGDVSGSLLCARVTDNTERLTVEGLAAMPASTVLCAHNAVLLAAVDKQLWVSKPYMPYLCDMATGFYLFKSEITNVVSCGQGVFITADKTYYLLLPETASPALSTVSEVDAVAGTAVTLPNGAVSWFTRRGAAIGGPDGTVTYPSDPHYAPAVSARGAAGFVDVDGTPAVITTLRGHASTSMAATSDACDLEIIRNE